MNGFAEHKVTNGKLLKARFEGAQHIVSLRFFGDFFLHPEETLFALEKTFSGKSIHFAPGEIEKQLQQVLEQNKAELVGATAADFVLVVRKAIQNAQSRK